MDKKLLTKIFKDNLLTSLEHIAHIYRHLFEILGDDQLESSLEFLHMEYTKEKGLPKDEQYWFYSFHKSIRQTDFFNGCEKNETHDINGHLDGILWNLIHTDKKDVLRLTMLRSFKEHDLELEMDEENPKKS